MSTWDAKTRSELTQRLLDLKWDPAWIQAERLQGRLDRRTTFARTYESQKQQNLINIRRLCLGEEFAPAVVSVHLQLPSSSRDSESSDSSLQYSREYQLFNGYNADSLHLDDNETIKSIFEDPTRIFVDSAIDLSSIDEKSLQNFLCKSEFQISGMFRDVSMENRRKSREAINAFLSSSLSSFSSLLQSAEERSQLLSLFIDMDLGADTLITELRPLLGRESVRLVIYLWRIFAIQSLESQGLISESTRTSLLQRCLTLPKVPHVVQKEPSAQITIEVSNSDQENAILAQHDEILRAAEAARSQRVWHPVVSDSYRAEDKDRNIQKTDLDILAEQRDYKRRRASYRAKRTHITKRTPAQIARDLIRIMMEDLLPPPPAPAQQTSVEPRQDWNRRDTQTQDRTGRSWDSDRFRSGEDRDRHDRRDPHYDSRRSYDTDRSRHSDRSSRDDRSRDYSREHERSRDRDEDRDRDRGRDREWDRDKGRDRHERDKDRDRYRDSERDRDRDRDKYRDYESDRSQRSRGHERERDSGRDAKRYKRD